MAHFLLRFVQNCGTISIWKRAVFNAGGIKNGNNHEARKYI